MMKHLHFGSWAREMQKTSDETTMTFLKIHSWSLLLFTLGVLPAVGEELLFRGVLLRLVHRRAYGSPNETLNLPNQEAQRKMIYPVVFTALLFALIHFNPYGFVFIFIAGCMLALIYYLTGSLLCSMLAHFIYNGTQVAVAMLTEQTAPMSAAEADLPSWPLVLGGLILFLACFYALIRTQRPLPPYWSQDYLPGEE
jgi:membrane protease YdiL (CAAX protease family)